jgi:hypothetical protein
VDTPDEAEWEWIKPHLDRDAVIVVSPRLDLGDAGAKIAGDDTETVKIWLAQNVLAKPTAEQIAIWAREPHRRFKVLVVQPYVLIQEIGFH